MYGPRLGPIGSPRVGTGVVAGVWSPSGPDRVETAAGGRSDARAPRTPTVPGVWVGGSVEKSNRCIPLVGSVYDLPVSSG